MNSFRGNQNYQKRFPLFSADLKLYTKPGLSLVIDIFGVNPGQTGFEVANSAGNPFRLRALTNFSPASGRFLRQEYFSRRLYNRELR